MSVGMHRFVSAHLFLNQQPVMWTDKFRYLGVQFLCGNTIEVDVVPVKRRNTVFWLGALVHVIL